MQILPEQLVLACLTQLPREDHDAVADCSVGFRALMRSERFRKWRHAEDILEEALVIIGEFGSLALVFTRVWRWLRPMRPEIRIDFNYHADRGLGVARSGTAVVGSELFVVGGVRRNGSSPYWAGTVVYDALDDDWFTMPLPSHKYRGFGIELFAVGCDGQLYVGGLNRYGAHQGRFLFSTFDPDTRRWVKLPSMPPLLRPRPSGFEHQLIAVAVGSEIFVLDRARTISGLLVFNVNAKTWRRVPLPVFDLIVCLSQYQGVWSPWPSLCVDGTLIHVLDHASPSDDHYAFDTVTHQWRLLDGLRGLARHTVFSSKSDRVLSVVNHDGPDDFIPPTGSSLARREGNYHTGSSRGGVNAFRRRGEDLELTDTIDLPVRYDTVQRAFYVDMA